MSTVPAKPPRKRAQAMAQGRGAAERLVLPLAFDTAALVSARPLDDFLHDPTQLANGLLELHRALGSDGICVALADDFEYASAAGGPLDVSTLTADGTRVAASLEACRRLRATLGDGAVLLAGLTGPATLAARFASDTMTAGAVFTALVKLFCEAGSDIVLVFETAAGDAATEDALKTATNIARFHRALACGLQPGGALPVPTLLALDAPPHPGPGLVLTSAPTAADADIEALRDWVAAQRT